jgi:hypothetical protein
MNYKIHEHLKTKKRSNGYAVHCIFDLLLSDNNRLVLKNVHEKEINEKQKR